MIPGDGSKRSDQHKDYKIQMAFVDEKTPGDENDLAFEESPEENDEVAVINEILKKSLHR